MKLLEVVHASVTYGSVVALNRVSIALATGRRLGVMGSNGSGKSTLLSVLGGQIAVPAGTVWFDGHDVSRLGPGDRARVGLSRMFQESRLWGDMSVAEHLQVMEDVKPVRGVRLTNLTAALELGRRELGLEPGALTLLQRRRVELAMALYGTRVLLCDELGAGLNMTEAQSLYGVVCRAVQERWIEAALMIEHRQQLLRASCDDVLVLDSGAQSAFKSTTVPPAFADAGPKAALEP